mmetsp:Transcript_62227/g.170976  ORF Transcript_62227/g.170976 Transcript_62227/m.170976 type:complete len:226 (+) Transcript_62227:424-1101(+)|eukprot:5066981-Prymnesium_polylepis.1
MQSNALEQSHSASQYQRILTPIIMSSARSRCSFSITTVLTSSGSAKLVPSGTTTSMSSDSCSRTLSSCSRNLSSTVNTCGNSLNPTVMDMDGSMDAASTALLHQFSRTAPMPPIRASRVPSSSGRNLSETMGDSTGLAGQLSGGRTYGQDDGSPHSDASRSVDAPVLRSTRRTSRAAEGKRSSSALDVFPVTRGWAGSSSAAPSRIWSWLESTCCSTDERSDGRE